MASYHERSNEMSDAVTNAERAVKYLKDFPDSLAYREAAAELARLKAMLKP